MGFIFVIFIKINVGEDGSEQHSMVLNQHYELLMHTFLKMGESSSVSEYKRHEEYLKRHTVYKAQNYGNISSDGKGIRRYV